MEEEGVGRVAEGNAMTSIGWIFDPTEVCWYVSPILGIPRMLRAEGRQISLHGFSSASGSSNPPAYMGPLRLL